MVRTIPMLSLFLLLLLASAVAAQTPPTCGILEVEGPSEVDLDTPLVFKVRITGVIHTTKPEFKWWLSAGTIMTGEGKDEITVDTTGLGGQVLTVTVGLSGAPPGCSSSASKTTSVKAPPFVCGLPFDRYGNITFEDEKARLDNFAIQLMDEPLSMGSIMMTAGQETFENEAAERLDRAKSYLVNVRGIDSSRLVTFDCGYTQDLYIRLIIIPNGAVLPECDHSFDVPFSAVKFTKPRPQSSKKKR